MARQTRLLDQRFDHGPGKPAPPPGRGPLPRGSMAGGRAGRAVAGHASVPALPSREARGRLRAGLRRRGLARLPSLAAPARSDLALDRGFQSGTERGASPLVRTCPEPGGPAAALAAQERRGTRPQARELRAWAADASPRLARGPAHRVGGRTARGGGWPPVDRRAGRAGVVREERRRTLYRRGAGPVPADGGLGPRALPAPLSLRNGGWPVRRPGLRSRPEPGASVWLKRVAKVRMMAAKPGWQVHRGVSWRGRASLSPARSAASPTQPAGRAPPEWPKSS